MLSIWSKWSSSSASKQASRSQPSFELTPTNRSQRDLYLNVLALLADFANILNQAHFNISVLALFQSALFRPLLQSPLMNSLRTRCTLTCISTCWHFSGTANCQPRTQLDLYLNVPALFAVRGLHVNLSTCPYKFDIALRIVTVARCIPVSPNCLCFTVRLRPWNGNQALNRPLCNKSVSATLFSSLVVHRTLSGL